MVNNPDKLFLGFLRGRTGIIMLTEQRIYGDPDIPPEQRGAEKQFVLAYPRGQGFNDEESAIGSRMYAVESYGLRPALCETLDDAVFESIEGRATGLIRQITQVVPRQLLQRPDNKWWFALSTYKILYVTNLIAN